MFALFKSISYFLYIREGQDTFLLGALAVIWELFDVFILPT